MRGGIQIELPKELPACLRLSQLRIHYVHISFLCRNSAALDALTVLQKLSTLEHVRITDLFPVQRAM